MQMYVPDLMTSLWGLHVFFGNHLGCCVCVEGGAKQKWAAAMDTHARNTLPATAHAPAPAGGPAQGLPLLHSE